MYDHTEESENEVDETFVEKEDKPSPTLPSEKEESESEDELFQVPFTPFSL